MTDAETLARLRASDMSPGEFLDALEETQEMILPVFPAPSRDDYATMQEERDRWRFTAIASWGMWTLTLLVVWSNS